MEEGKDRTAVQKEVTDKYSLRGRVFHRIREDILSGKYSENDELKEATIGAEFGVSRTPVREALRQLELEGLVSIVPNKGAYVTGISDKDTRDIYVIRSYLEGLAARWACDRISEEEIEKAAPDNKIIILSLVLLIVLSIAWKFYSNSVQEVPVAQTQTREEAFEPENPYPFDNVTTKQESYVAPQDKEPDAVPPVPPRKPAVPEEKPAAVSEKTKTMAEQSAVSDVSVEEKERENKPEAVDAVKRDPVDVKTEKPAETVPVAQETVAPKPYVPKIFGIKNVDARIVLRAKEETWIEVTRGDEVLLTRTLYAGDRYRVPVDSKDLYLKTGNAGGLDVLVDGTLVPSLGKRGSTKSKIALDADSFLVNVSEED